MSSKNGRDSRVSSRSLAPHLALEMSRYSAKSWKDRADEIRDIRDNITGEEPRRILAEIAAEFDRLHDWTLKQSGPFEAAASDRRSGVQSIFGCHAGSQAEKMSTGLAGPSMPRAHRR